MNTTLATFLKIGITAASIGLLLFGVGYVMVTAESTHYEGQIESVQAQLP